MRDGGDGSDGGFGIPPHGSRHRHAAVLLSEARRRIKQGVSPAIRESRGNGWHTTLLARCSVLHPVNAVGKIGTIFLTQGWVYEPREGE